MSTDSIFTREIRQYKKCEVLVSVLFFLFFNSSTQTIKNEFRQKVRFPSILFELNEWKSFATSVECRKV